MRGQSEEYFAVNRLRPAISLGTMARIASSQVRGVDHVGAVNAYARLQDKEFEQHDSEPANFGVKPTAGRSPRPGLKPLFPPETNGGTPPATALFESRRQAARRSARTRAGPRCGLHQ